MFPKETKFLIIDDFPTVRKFLKLNLMKLGYNTVDFAEDGNIAFQKLQEAHAQKTPYQFVISDLNMPGISGLELLKKCRDDDRFKDLPFLMLTAERAQDKVKEAIQLKVNDYLVKPFDEMTLKKKIEGIYTRVQTTAKSA
ncbi:MAG: hypothetical protein A4S09_16790 [Proteobacteria bacterium SG_bin7]|nr:MAG: hypothetical protein A4S09_16790 [Proteobacteria bacterium SG_bin7]